MTQPSREHRRQCTVAAIEAVPIYRDGLSLLVGQLQGMAWVGCATSYEAALRLADGEPDMVLLDSALDPDGRLTRALTIGERAPRVVVLAREGTDAKLHLSAGARAAVPRTAEPKAIAEALRNVHLGLVYLHPALDRPAQTTSTPLTPREFQVLCSIADGKSNTAIATELDVSAETVRTHVKKILRKLQARDRTHAVATAFREGVLSPDNAGPSRKTHYAATSG